MQKNDLFQCGNDIFRVLEIKQDSAFIINCTRQTMPQWCDFAVFSDYKICTEQDLLLQSGIILSDIDMLSPVAKRIIRERYTIVAGVLPFLLNPKLRSAAISRIAENHSICKQTVRNYLCLYLAYQDITILAPKSDFIDKPLSQDEKNMRWALNKYFYNQRKNRCLCFISFLQFLFPVAAIFYRSLVYIHSILLLITAASRQKIR